MSAVLKHQAVRLPDVAPAAERLASRDCVVISPAASGGVHDYANEIAHRTGAARAVFECGDLRAIGGRCQGYRSIYLQMSGYGYHDRGVPLALLAWLERQKAAGIRIGTFFHELYAFGPAWTSSFWLSPAQRYVAARCAALSAFWITNRQASADWLLRWSAPRPHTVLPTPSNVGELECLPVRKQPWLVVFGSPELRERVYRLAGPAMFDWAGRNGVLIHDIGAPITAPDIAGRLLSQAITRHGRLEPGHVSRLLADAAFGVLAYPVAYAAKSSVLAAYCAHGVCPILLSQHHPAVDGLRIGENYVGDFETLDMKVGGWSEVASAAFEWYRPHRMQCHVAEALRLHNL